MHIILLMRRNQISMEWIELVTSPNDHGVYPCFAPFTLKGCNVCISNFLINEMLAPRIVTRGLPLTQLCCYYVFNLSLSCRMILYQVSESKYYMLCILILWLDCQTPAEVGKSKDLDT